MITKLKRKFSYYFGTKDFTYYEQSGVLDPELYEVCFELSDMTLYYVGASETRSGINYFYSSYIDSTKDI